MTDLAVSLETKVMSGFQLIMGKVAAEPFVRGVLRFLLSNEGCRLQHLGVRDGLCGDKYDIGGVSHVAFGVGTRWLGNLLWNMTFIHSFEEE